MRPHIIYTLLFAFWMASLPLAFAQKPPKGGGTDAKAERINAFRIAYFTEKLALTPDESKLFWPLYDEFRQRQKTLRDGQKKLLKQDMDLLSDAELETLVNQRFQLREDEIKLEREYLTRFQTAIPIRKVVQLHRVEKQFREELLHIMQARREGGHGGGTPPPLPDRLPPPQH